MAAAMVAEAERYCNYSLTWYNRSGNVVSDINDPNPTKWTSSVPYSFLNSDNLETIISKCSKWTQPGQTRWYQYSPGKLAVNRYDGDNSLLGGYPWPSDFENLWTGTCCQAFLYNCAKKVGYNFTSDDQYSTQVTSWETLGTEINFSDAQPGDIVYFSGGDHVAIVLTPNSISADNIEIIQAFGEYQYPFNYQVSIANVGQTRQVYVDEYKMQKPDPVFRRLPQP